MIFLCQCLYSKEITEWENWNEWPLLKRMQQTQKGDSWGQQPLLTTCGATFRSALSSALSGPDSPAGKEKHLIALSSAHPRFGQSFPRGKSSSRGLAKQPAPVPGEPCQPWGSGQMTVLPQRRGGYWGEIQWPLEPSSVQPRGECGASRPLARAGALQELGRLCR